MSTSYFSSPFPDPDGTTEITPLEFQRLPSFLTHRVSDFGYSGHDSTHRVDHFLVVPHEIREAIIRSYLGYGLSNRRNLTLMLRLPIVEIQRMESFWRAIEDCLLFSSIENFSGEHTAPIRRIFDWYVSSYVYAGYAETLSCWKKFTNFVKQRAALAVDCKISEPTGFPWFNTMTKKLVKTGIVWMDAVVQRGLLSKGETTRLSHLISIRGAPTPNFEMKVASLLTHQINLRSEPAKVDIAQLMFTFKAGESIGLRAKSKLGERSLLSAEHISLTNSSCYENPRSKGGRATYARGRIYAWANFVSAKTETFTTCLGHTVTFHEGRPRWKDFTPVVPLNEWEEQDGVVFSQEIPAETTIMVKRAGFNKNLGYLILQTAFDEAVEKKVITRDYSLGEVLIKKRAVSLGEPGGKSRSLTIGEWFEPILLQPLGHILVESLSNLEECRAGLARGEPLWQMLQEIQQKIKKQELDSVFIETMWLKSTDLKEATDHAHREIVKYLLCGYLSGLGKQYANPYLLLSVELLVSPREVVWSLQ